MVPLLTEVRPDQLHDYWPVVEKGLLRVKRKTHPTWIPADIYSAIKTGNAVLFMISDTAFCVLQKVSDFDGPRLLVWVIYGPHELATREQELTDWLKEKARFIGAKAIRLHSPRRWESRGWTKRETIFEIASL